MALETEDVNELHKKLLDTLDDIRELKKLFEVFTIRLKKGYIRTDKTYSEENIE